MSLVKKPTGLANWFLPGIILGMLFTLKKMIYNIFNQQKMETLNYPEEKYQYGPRFKGNHVLTVKKDGSLRCTACMLCATNCPAECIKITAAEHNDPAVEKFPIAYEIDILRCVFCGFCQRQGLRHDGRAGFECLHFARMVGEAAGFFDVGLERDLPSFGARLIECLVVTGGEPDQVFGL